MIIKRGKFLRDLNDGKKAEEYIAELYHDNFFPSAEYMFNATKAYDICFLFPRKKRVRIEVKYDKMANKTGNLCFELTDYKGRPSGVMATEADLMVFMLTDKIIYEFNVKKLRSFVEEHMSTDRFKIVKGGDGNAFEMMLVPIDEILDEDFCSRIIVE